MQEIKKTATIDLKGKAYATVPARIKEFREACPNGLIETKPEPQTDGQMMFTARILKDKSDVNSGEATGHSIGKITGDKNFEKLETIAVGRALALLGYMASGEIASSEEMDEFNSYKKDKYKNQVSEAIEKLKACKTAAALKKAFYENPAVLNDKEVIAVKDEMKLILK